MSGDDAAGKRITPPHQQVDVYHRARSGELIITEPIMLEHHGTQKSREASRLIDLYQEHI